MTNERLVELAAFRAAKPLYEGAKAEVQPGEYGVDRVVHLVGEVKKGTPYVAEVAMRADPWKLLAIALSKLNGVTIESIVEESLRPSEEGTMIKAAAEAAIKRIVKRTVTQLDGRITGKVIMEVL